MKQPPSLARRLSLQLLAAAIVGAVLFWLLYISVSLAGVAGQIYLTPQDLSEYAARRLVIQSIVADADGSRSIKPTPQLLAKIARTPTLHYAVFDTNSGAPLSGSDKTLVSVFNGFDKAPPLTGKMDYGLNLDDGRWEARMTSVGNEWLVVVLYGYTFDWRDAPISLFGEFWDAFSWSAPVFLFTAGLIWLSVRRGLSPLQRIAAEARAISFDSLDKRLAIDDVPEEVSPLIEALNEALVRLDAGAARQRRFLANAAHELRTPIAALRARLDDIQSGEARTDLLRHARHMKALIDQLLASARPASAKTPTEQEIDLAAIALAQVSDFTPLTLQSKKEIDYQGPMSGVIMRGDRLAIESIIANLIDNALRAEPDGGTIVVRLDKSCMLEVIDHGGGVAETDREKVFEPFWRRHDGASGAGLGLAIVKDLVEFHEGIISVKDTEGGGATFVVDLSRRKMSG